MRQPMLATSSNGRPASTASSSRSFRVDARLVGWKISADDQDIHFVIRDLDTNHTLIAEFPADACVPTADPSTGQKGTRKKDSSKMSAARAAVTKVFIYSRSEEH